MLEEKIEDYLRQRVAAAGGLCVKLNPKGYKGIPDRLVLLPRARVVFVELKRPKGGVVARLQEYWRARLRGLGYDARIISEKIDVDVMLVSLGFGSS